MAMRRIAKQHFISDQRLRYRARQNNLDPAEINIYPSKRPPKNARKTISRYFNSFEISDRARFSLRAYGVPFSWQGVVTKSYSTKTMLKLFNINKATLYRWVKEGIMPEAAVKLKVQGKEIYRNTWLYHQVQPVYIWYMHMSARGMKRLIVASNQDEVNVLRRLLIAQEKRWLAKLGVEYIDSHVKKCGKFGVIHLTD
jgi:hypothetical protein